MKINKGMYIRTKKGIIRKWSEYDVLIKEWEDRFNYNDEDGDLNFVFEDEIAKYSNNIIDLIEVGDYVNGNKVTKLGFDKLLLHCKTIECHQEDLSRGYEGVTFVYTNNDIKDVVTKEQFNSMKYVVERDK